MLTVVTLQQSRAPSKPVKQELNWFLSPQLLAESLAFPSPRVQAMLYSYIIFVTSYSYIIRKDAHIYVTEDEEEDENEYDDDDDDETDDEIDDDVDFEKLKREEL